MKAYLNPANPSVVVQPQNGEIALPQSGEMFIDQCKRENRRLRRSVMSSRAVAQFGFSLRELRVLCVSAVEKSAENAHRRGAENAESRRRIQTEPLPSPSVVLLERAKRLLREFSRYKHFVPAALSTLKPAAALFLLVIAVSVGAQQPQQKDAASELKNNGPQANDPATPVAADEELYRIGTGDVLDVRVFNRPQLSRESVRVDNRGMIHMPLIDSEIRAGCRTEAELAAEVANLYLKYQRHPHVDVFIKEYSSRPVAVMGAVSKPGQFQLQRRVRLLELVSLAGGPTERAGQRVLVAHGTEISSCDENTAAAGADGFESFDLNNTLKADGAANPFVRPGDIITVPEAQQVFVTGNVLRPMSIPLKETITLSQAVAMAGGTMPDSKKTGIRVLRQLPGAPGKTELVVDLEAITKRKADDIELQANDIVDVPTATGKRIFRTLLSAVAPTAGSLPVRVIH